MGDLAREAFELELGRTLRLERHRRSGVTAHGVARRALMRDQHPARPSSPTRRAARMRRSRSSSRRSGRSSGYVVRWTDASAPGAAASRASPWYMSSLTNGITGAIRRMRVLSVSYMVWYAASESPCERAFQKRARLRRTYQVERTSQNASILKIADRTS